MAAKPTSTWKPALGKRSSHQDPEKNGPFLFRVAARAWCTNKLACLQSREGVFQIAAVPVSKALPRVMIESQVGRGHEESVFELGDAVRISCRILLDFVSGFFYVDYFCAEFFLWMFGRGVLCRSSCRIFGGSCLARRPQGRAAKKLQKRLLPRILPKFIRYLPVSPHLDSRDRRSTPGCPYTAQLSAPLVGNTWQQWVDAGLAGWC